MTVNELSVDQLEELKEHYACEITEDDPDFFDEHDGYEISDYEVMEHYSGIDFGNDDFFCTAGMDDEEVVLKPIDDFLDYFQKKSNDDYFLGGLNNYKIYDMLHNLIAYVAETLQKNEEDYRFAYILSDMLNIPDDVIEKHFDTEGLFYNLGTLKDRDGYIYKTFLSI